MKKQTKSDAAGKRQAPVADTSPHIKLISTLLIALAIALLIELSNHRSFGAFFRFVFLTPHIFFLNFVIIFFTFSFSLLFKRRRAFILAMGSVWAAFGITDFIMRFFRVTPFAATDISLLSSVWSVMFVYLKIWQMILIAVGILLCIAAIVFACMRLKKENVNFKVAACTVSITAVLLFGLLTVFLRTETLPHHFDNLPDAYKEYGFAYSFCVGIFDRGIDRPDNYTPENADDILNAIGASKKDTGKTKPNIVFVQLESFFDVKYLKDIEFSEDPVPNFTKLKREYSNGFLTVPALGSGTANTEFEIITGMSLEYFGTAEYPYKTVLRNTTCETLAYNLREQGYFCHALHNHSGTFYDRNKVYANLGFDDFISIEYMKNTTENPIGWAEDAVLTSEIIEAMTSTEERDLVYAISVQAHGRYPTEDIGEEQRISVYGLEDEASEYAYTYYVNQLFETDAFVGELVSALGELDEPTICVFFGDHLPSLNIENEDITNGNVYQTEYVIWSNIELERTVTDMEAYQLSAYVLSKAGFSNGIFTKLHQNYSENENYHSALEMLEYDVLYGNYYAYNGKQKYLPTDLRMGLGNIRITDVRAEDGLVTVSGENFTKYSSVIIDGRKIKTEYVDEHTLVGEIGIFDDADTVRETTEVGQYTKNGEFLGSVAFDG